MSIQLTNGGIYKIFNNPDVESPIFQVLTIKPIHSGNRDNFFLRLSDGTHYSFCCIVGTQLNWVVENLTPNSKIRVNRYVCNICENSKVVIILDLDVLHIGGIYDGVVGNPTRYKASVEQGVSNNVFYSNSQNSTKTLEEEFDELDSPASSISDEEPVEVLFSSQEFNQSGTSSSSQSSSLSGRSSIDTASLQSISNLTDYLHRWTIRARVTNKSILYENKERESVHFFFDLLDESGEIRATVFNEHCNKFYNMIEVIKVYYITQSIVKDSEKTFNPLNHDYEINFNYRTQVQLCETETNIPMQRFHFVSINEIGSLDPGKLIDVIGICKRISELANLNGSRKRDVQIVDNSQTEIRVALWEIQADNFDGTLDSVIAIKGAKVSEFRGRSLSIATSQIVEVNPNIDEARYLRAWYENGGRDMPTRNLTEDHWSDDLVVWQLL